LKKKINDFDFLIKQLDDSVFMESESQEEKDLYERLKKTEERLSQENPEEASKVKQFYNRIKPIIKRLLIIGVSVTAVSSLVIYISNYSEINKSIKEFGVIKTLSDILKTFYGKYRELIKFQGDATILRNNFERYKKEGLENLNNEFGYKRAFDGDIGDIINRIEFERLFIDKKYLEKIKDRINNLRIRSLLRRDNDKEELQSRKDKYRDDRTKISFALSSEEYHKFFEKAHRDLNRIKIEDKK